LRLRALELIEEKGGEKGGQQNDFKKALEDVEQSELVKHAMSGGKAPSEVKGTGKEKGKEKDEQRTSVIDLGLIKSDPDRLYPLIYNALKRTLKEWEESMNDRPGE